MCKAKGGREKSVTRKKKISKVGQSIFMNICFIGIQFKLCLLQKIQEIFKP